MKAGWKTVKLGEACKIVNGATPSTSVEANWGGPHCWITPAEMGGLSVPYVGETRRTLTDVGLADCSASLLPAGSVILSSRAPIGHVIINTVPMATNQGCKSMIPRSDLDAKFLFYFIKANVPLLESLGTGATFKELSGGKLASVEIPLPPLAEQKRIVALLDEAFAGIDAAKAKAEVNRKNAQALLESHIQAIFTNRGPDWEEKKISDLSDHITVGFVGSMAHLFVAKGIPLLRGQNIRKHGIQFDNLKYISKETHAKWEKSALIPGDVAIVRVGYPGTAAVVPEGSPELNAASLVIVRPNPRLLDSYFLSHALNSEWGKSVIKARSVGAAQQVFNTGTAANLEIPLPTLIEQKQIVKRLDELSDETQRLVNVYTNKHTELVNLKSALLSQAFAGELTA